MFTHAITRKPGPDFADGLTLARLGKPDFDLIKRQHAAYTDALKARGLKVIEMEALQGHPDAYFVEDPAVVTAETAVVTIPGAVSRRGEQESLAGEISPYREINRIESPGTVDGGDVLIAGKRVFIGISARTNLDGATQLGEILGHHGYTWTGVRLQAGLHLKSDVNLIAENTLLITERFSKMDEFDGFHKIILAEGETYAANTLLLNDCLLTPKGFPDTYEKITRTGYDIVQLDMSEVQKMDGGLTCLSLRF